MPSSGAERAAVASAGMSCFCLPVPADTHEAVELTKLSTDSGPANLHCICQVKRQGHQEPACIRDSESRPECQGAPKACAPAPPQFFPQGGSKIVCTPLIPALWRKKQVHFSPVYILSSGQPQRQRETPSPEKNRTTMTSTRKMYKGKEKCWHPPPRGWVDKWP